jgi:hypothetical protein
MQALLGIFLVAVAGQFVVPFFNILNVIVSLFCYRMIIHSAARRARMDEIFSKQGWSQKRNFEPGTYPADGWHIVFLQGSILIGQKYTIRSERSGSEVYYELFIFGHHLYQWIAVELRGKKDTISVMLCDTPTIWRTECYTVPHSVKHEPYPWQVPVLQTLTDRFKKDGRVSVLIWGESGAGKSEIAYLLNKKLMEESLFQIVPITVEADITKKGLSLSDLCMNPPKERPAILLFNELDSMVEHAESERDAKSDGMSLAGTKQSLLNTLDRINRFRNVVLIATMNAEPEKIPLVYRRPGRFDLVLEAKKN